LWIGTLAFGTGFASLAVFGPTMKRCKALSGVGKSLLVASPALSGSFPRIPFGGNIGRTGGGDWTKLFLILSSLGMLLNTVLAYTTIDDLETMENFSGTYFLWLIGGLGAGFGIAVFPMIINVLFWTKQKEIGFSQAVFGGLGNCTAGIFALLMPIVINW
jgi:nitrate/nitrite transporter NarK